MRPSSKRSRGGGGAARLRPPPRRSDEVARLLAAKASAIAHGGSAFAARSRARHSVRAVPCRVTTPSRVEVRLRRASSRRRDGDVSPAPSRSVTLRRWRGWRRRRSSPRWSSPPPPPLISTWTDRRGPAAAARRRSTSSCGTRTAPRPAQADQRLLRVPVVVGPEHQVGTEVVRELPPSSSSRLLSLKAAAHGQGDLQTATRGASRDDGDLRGVSLPGARVHPAPVSRRRRRLHQPRTARSSNAAASTRTRRWRWATPTSSARPHSSSTSPSWRAARRPRAGSYRARFRERSDASRRMVVSAATPTRSASGARAGRRRDCGARRRADEFAARRTSVLSKLDKRGSDAARERAAEAELGAAVDGPAALARRRSRASWRRRWTSRTRWRPT